MRTKKLPAPRLASPLTARVAIACTIRRPGSRQTVRIAMPGANVTQWAEGFVNHVLRRFGVAAVRQVAAQHSALAAAAAKALAAT